MLKLKKLLFLLAVTTLASYQAHAADEWKVGALVGLSVSNMDVSNDNVSANLDSRTGVAAGITAEGHLADLFYFQPEVLYVQKGFNVPNSDTTLSANYIDIPLLLKFKVNAGPVSPYLLFGPDFGLKIKSDAYNDNTSTSVSGIKTFDFGLDFGAGVETALTAGMRGFIDVRYDLGLTNVDSNTIGDESVKNRDWMFLVGVRF